MLHRRSFLLAGLAACAAARELKCDVAILGGGTGGVAAAIAALRNGMRVVMTEETDWIGGQLTSQMVPPDEHPWIEQFGGKPNKHPAIASSTASSASSRSLVVEVSVHVPDASALQQITAKQV